MNFKIYCYTDSPQNFKKPLANFGPP